jgi:hypothetical protein
MAEASCLSNGRFLLDLSNWTAASAVYQASDGDEQYGMASLSVGGSISQNFTVPYIRAYTFHASVKAAATLTSGQVTAVITQGGNAVTTINLTGAAISWLEITTSLGLVPGVTYTLTINAVSVAVKVDDVWLWPVPISRSEIASRVHTKLGLLASDLSYSTALAGSLTEGHYTYAIDSGLRQIGAVDVDTDTPDVRCVAAGAIEVLLNAVEYAMLERLQRDYATMVDIDVGPRKEKLSQIAAAIGKLKSALSPQSTGMLYAGRETSFTDQLGISLLYGG